MTLRAPKDDSRNKNKTAFDLLRAIARVALLSWTAVTIAALIWTLSRNPFLAPYVAASADQARLQIETAVAGTVTEDWLAPRVETALLNRDLQELTLLRSLAQDHGIALPADLTARADQLQQEHQGVLATVNDCGRCMIDLNDCPSLQMVAACAVPFEMSPAGDVAALARQAKAKLTGAEVDTVEVALASVGLAATGGALISAGSTVSVKASATILRSARRARALSPGMQKALQDVARGARPTSDLGEILADLGIIARHSSVPEIIPILRLADNPSELRQLARLSEVTGKNTRKSLNVLGKSKSLRLLSRFSDLALTALGLIGLLLGQIAALIGAMANLIIRSALKKNSYNRA
ncbi:hypothetical protein PAF17_10240 [Paracoccus sp. Z330]|uniref:DUF697 domain-containing protein n=1 Tax=Paracoccus onchidii TaxID=3017813 RepID=A0ABT4ZES9_9RHOB|nr:hypothetical protein [Paracoccus onchidii]MDB6177880.1 hypothetical protein [Paracoccus onchidii]